MAENSTEFASNEELSQEIERLLNDLNECRKQLDFMQNYRKILINFNTNCFCNQNSDIKTIFKDLEIQYKNVFNKNQNQFTEQTINDNSKNKSEDVSTTDPINETRNIVPEVMTTKVIFSTFDDKSVEPKSGSDMDVIAIEEQESSGDRNCDQQKTGSNIEGMSSDNSKQINEKSGNFVLVFNKQNSTLIKKSYDKIDKNVEIIVSKLNVRQNPSIIKSSVGITPLKVSANTSIISINDNYWRQLKNKETNIKPFLMTSGKKSFQKRTINQKMIKIKTNTNQNRNQKSGLNNKRLKSQNLLRSKPNELISNLIQQNEEVLNVSNIPSKYKSFKRSEDVSNILPNFHNSLFYQLLEQLKTGTIDSFIHPEYKLVTVFLNQNYANEPKNDIKRREDRRFIYKCNYDICKYQTPLRRNVRQHIATHEKDCSLCGKQFESKVALVEHKIQVHNISDKLFKCDFPDCGFKTTFKQSLQIHSFVHKTDRPVKCTEEDCELSFKNNYQLRCHLKVHEQRALEKNIECQWPGCDHLFRTVELMKHHIKTHTGERPSVTKIREYLQNGDYVSSVDRNNKMFSVIRKQININGQIGIGEKLGYKCNYTNCDFVSIQNRKITEHLVFHSAGKTLKCDLCDKKFASDRYLKNHKKLVHNTHNYPLMSCEYPGCNFNTTNIVCFKQHTTVTHQIETPFKCDRKGCDKQFKTKISLKIHLINRHSKAKPFACEWPKCEAAFKLKAPLKLHIKKVHENPDFKPKYSEIYRCDYCSKTFKLKPFYERHLKSKH